MSTTGDRWKLLALTSLALWIVVGVTWLIGSSLFAFTTDTACTRETLRTIPAGDDIAATIFTTTCRAASQNGAPITTSVALTRRGDAKQLPNPTDADIVFTARDKLTTIDITWPRPQTRDQLIIDYPSTADIQLAIIRNRNFLITYRPR